MNIFQNYINLARLNKPFAILLLYLPCLWGIGAGIKYTNLSFFEIIFFAVILAVGALCSRSFGCIINDIADRNIDAKIDRTLPRPLASGALSTKKAIIFAAICGLCCLLLLWLLPLKAVIACLISVPLICIYPFCKRFFAYPQLILGVVFNLGLFVAYFCIADGFNTSLFLLYVVAILWTIIYDTIYAMQDVYDDIKHGVKSSAVSFGYKNGILQIDKIKNVLLFLAFVIFILLGFVEASLAAKFLLSAASIVNVLIIILSFNGKVSYRYGFNLSNAFGLLVFIGLIL